MKRLLAITLCSLALLGTPFGANETQAAEEYPVKPIFLIVPIEAGSDGDIITRPLAEKAAGILGKPIVVVNKPGAGSSIGYREIYGAKPDGYTIGMATITIVTNKISGLLSVDYHDFTLMGTFYRMYADLFASTKTKNPFKTAKEVMAYAKANPGSLKVATSSVGSSLWIGTMSFISGTGIDLNVIPSAGGGGYAITQAAGGHTDLAVTHMASAKPQIDAGNLRFLAVIGDERDPNYPEVPTLKELGYNVGWESFGTIIGPPKMPQYAVDKLRNAFRMAATDPQYHKFLVSKFANPFYIPHDKIIPYAEERGKTVRDIMNKAGVLKEK